MKTIRLKFTDMRGTRENVKEFDIPYYETADPALVVHKAAAWWGEELQTLKSWRITQKPTGLHIFTGYTRRADAIAAAAELAKLTDWSKITLENCGAFYAQNETRLLELKRSIR